MGLTSFYICISFLIVGFSSNEGPPSEFCSRASIKVPPGP